MKIVQLNSNKGPEVCAVAALLYGGKVLILLRGSDAPWEPNKWSLVGGGVEQDETEENAIARESIEEIGMYPENIQFIKRISTPDIGEIAYFKGTLPSNKVVLNFENTEYRFIDVDEVDDFNFVPYVKDVIQGLK